MPTGRMLASIGTYGIGISLCLSLGCAASKAPQPSPSTIDSPENTPVRTAASTTEEAIEPGPDKDLLGQLQRQLLGVEPGGPQVIYTRTPETTFAAEDWSAWGLDGSWRWRWCS